MIYFKAHSLPFIFYSLLSILYFPSHAQDGSDMLYYDPENLNNSVIGKRCFIDFGSNSRNSRSVDTLTINVKGEDLTFVEHRVDNGYNWYKDQYLEQIPGEENIVVRLTDTRIDSLTKDKIYTTSVIRYYALNNYPLDTITVINHSYDRKNVVEVLVKKEEK